MTVIERQLRYRWEWGFDPKLLPDPKRNRGQQMPVQVTPYQRAREKGRLGARGCGAITQEISRRLPKAYRFRYGGGSLARTMALAPTYRRRLYERALDQYGYVTTRDADEIGVPPGELRKLSGRGGLEHVGHGLYRFEDIPRTGRDQFMEAVLRVGPGAYLEGDAVLALHDLALANPRRIRVATPRRDRRKHPDFLKVERRNLPADERTVYEGIPATTVARALLDCRGAIMDERLIEAAREAARTGLLRRGDAQRVLSDLGAKA